MKVILFLTACWALASASAQQGTLLISELLFQPRSGEAEFVELYNNSSSPIELSDYHIVRWVSGNFGKHYELPQYTVAPHDYVVLTKDVASVTTCFHVQYASKLLQCDLPPYPNDGGSVVLATVDSIVIDRFDYLPSMHSRLLRNKAGVSLERRSFDHPTNEASNWFSAASTAGYGTPGYANSQSAELLVEEASFQFSTTLLSPDGDDYQDVLTIDYALDDGSLAARVDIYNAAGRLVRRLLSGGLLGAAGHIEWDGRDDAGTVLPQGQYVVQIAVYNEGGARQVVRRPVALVLQ